MSHVRHFFLAVAALILAVSPGQAQDVPQGAPATKSAVSRDDTSLPAACVFHIHTKKGIDGSDQSDVFLTDADASFTPYSGIVSIGGVPLAGAAITVTDYGYISDFSLGFDCEVLFPNPGSQTVARLAVGSYTGQESNGIQFLIPPFNLNYSISSWQVLEVQYDDSGHLLQFAVNFDGSKDNGKAVFQGEIRFHSTVALRGTVELAAHSLKANRSDSKATVSVERTGDTSTPITATYSTADYGAVRGVDYTPVQGELTWAAGDAQPKVFVVPVLGNPSAGDHVLFVNLTDPSLGTTPTAALTIIDNRLPAAATRPEPDGSIDANYNLGLSNSAEVALNAITPLADGGALVGGNFIYANGPAQPGLVRLDSQGLPSASFQSPFLSVRPIVNAIAVQPDGKFLVGGDFELAGPVRMVGICRLNPDGSVDGTFQPDLNSKSYNRVNGIALQPDGRLVIAGDFSAGSGLVRLNPDGSLDTSFRPPTVSYLQTYDFALLQPDGRLIVYAEQSGLKRLNADGSVDPSYLAKQANIYSGRSVALEPDGKLVFPAQQTSGQLIRSDQVGRTDPSFSVGLSTLSDEHRVTCVVLQPDGKLLVGRVGDASTPSIVRLNPDGSVDPSFRLANDLPRVVGTMALQADGSLLVSAGYLSTLTNGVVHTVLARLAGVAPVVNQPTVTIATETMPAVKSNLQAGQAVITRTGDLTDSLVVAYTVKGKAVAGVDYLALAGHQKIKAGQSTASIKVKPLASAPGRGPINVKITLQATSDYTLGISTLTKVKILDAPAP